MRKILLAAAVLVALAAPAGAQQLTEPKLIRLFEIATNPTAFDGTRQEFRCVVIRASLGRAECVVVNMSQQVVGTMPLLLERFDGETRQRIVNDCTGDEIRQTCIVDIEAEVRDSSGPAIYDPAVTWVDLSE